MHLQDFFFSSHEIQTGLRPDSLKCIQASISRHLSDGECWWHSSSLLYWSRTNYRHLLFVFVRLFLYYPIHPFKWPFPLPALLILISFSTSYKMAIIGIVPFRLTAKNQQLYKVSLICAWTGKWKLFPWKASFRVTFKIIWYLKDILLNTKLLDNTKGS
jgi:hypothetical protein